MYNGNRLILKNNVRGFCKVNFKKEFGWYNLLKILFKVCKRCYDNFFMD